MIFTGIGCFFDKIPESMDAGVQAFATNARQVGLSHIILKVVDGQTANGHGARISSLANTMKDNGLHVWGWQHICGDDPEVEAHLAIQSIRQFGLDGFVVHALSEYEQSGKAAAASAYMRAMRTELPKIPLALSSYPIPSYHPHFPWQNFLAYSDFNMPQLRWYGRGGSRSQIERCFREFQEIPPNRPVMPIGQFNSRNGQKAHPGEIRAFLQASKDLNLKGVNLLGWDISVSDYFSEALETIQNFPLQQSPQTLDIVDHFMAALNNANPSQVAAFYSSRSALVTSSQTYVGQARISVYYQQFFSQKLPNTFFEVTSSSGTGSSRNFRWRARARANIFSKFIRRPTAKPFNKFTDEHKIYLGVQFKKRARNSPRYHVIHVACVDLNDPHIGLMVTPHNGLGRTTSNFLDAYNAQLAINGDEWLSWRNPKGLAVSEGIEYSVASNEPTIYISKDNQVQFGGDRPPVVWNAISGSHTIVRNGEISSKINRCSKPDVYCTNRAPRTSVGITADNKLILIVVQGPNNDLRNALTLKELAALNLEFGVVEAINMDGGGSSAVAVDNYGIPQVVNSPSDGSERAVSNHLGIYARYMDTGSALKVDDGNDTFGLLDDKIVYHYSSYSIKGV